MLSMLVSIYVWLQFPLNFVAHIRFVYKQNWNLLVGYGGIPIRKMECIYIQTDHISMWRKQFIWWCVILQWKCVAAATVGGPGSGVRVAGRAGAARPSARHRQMLKCFGRKWDLKQQYSGTVRSWGRCTARPTPAQLFTAQFAPARRRGNVSRAAAGRHTAVQSVPLLSLQQNFPHPANWRARQPYLLPSYGSEQVSESNKTSNLQSQFEVRQTFFCNAFIGLVSKEIV